MSLCPPTSEGDNSKTSSAVAAAPLSAGVSVVPRPLDPQSFSVLQTRALEAAANGIVIADRTGKILWVNSAFSKLSGFTRGEACRATPKILKSGKHPPEFYRRLWGTILSGKVWTGQLINRRKNGVLYNEEMTITPVLGEDGRVTHFIAIKQDITRRTEFEAELRRERDLLRSLMDNLPDSIFFKDQQSRFTRINKALAHELGVASPEAAVGRSDADYFSVRQARQKLTEERRMMVEGTPIIGLIEREETKGISRWVSTTKVPLRDDDGNIAGLVGISRDVTPFKQAEQELRESHALADSLVRAIPFPLDIVDERGDVLFANSLMEELLSTNPLDRKCWSLYRDDGSKCVACPLD
ncbi:MAG TPA: PAS domain S-box protein, partial [Verrucomicrobiae bacterium]